MKRATIALLFNSKNQVLLGMKKRGFGTNLRNGFGGKPHGEESFSQTASRELHEESGIVLAPELLEKIGLLHFFFEDKPEWNQDVYVFRGEYDGDFEETDEMLPQRRDLDKIPYEHMWEDDKFRVPYVIDKAPFEFTFHFDKEGKLIVE